MEAGECESSVCFCLAILVLQQTLLREAESDAEHLLPTHVLQGLCLLALFLSMLTSFHNLLNWKKYSITKCIQFSNCTKHEFSKMTLVTVTSIKHSILFTATSMTSSGK